jgi:hypothetical protein
MKIERRNRNEKRVFVMTIETENGQKVVRTTCPTFSAPLIENGQLLGNCSKCFESAENKALCCYVMPKKQATKDKGKEKVARDTIDYKLIVSLFLEGKSKVEIMNHLNSVCSTESASKDLYGKVSCVFGACLYPARKDILVYQVVSDVLNTDCTLKETFKKYEGKHKGSVNYSYIVASAFKAIKAEKAE